jgi:hypothetical protein
MKRCVSIVLIFVTLSLVMLPAPHAVSAQNKLKYGDVVEGEITAAQTRAIYTFGGKKGDIVAVQSIAIDNPDGSAVDANLVLRDAQGTELTNAANNLNALCCTAALATMVMLPADGDYSITVQRKDQKSVGRFSLSLRQPSGVEFGKSYEETVFYRGRNSFVGLYQIPADKAVTLAFEFRDAAENAQVRVYSYEDKRLEEQISLEVNRLLNATLTIDAGIGVYLVAIGTPGWSPERFKMTYTMKVTQAGRD